jgi:flagellar assembly factor FliW
MKVKTEQFGVVQVEENKIFCMPAGMPGFLGRKRFVIIERGEIWPFLVFQCIDDENLSFFIMNPFLFKPDYAVDLEPVIKEMGWETESCDPLKIYVIVNTSSGIPEKITANLLGPLIINIHKMEVVQRVLHNSSYPHNYKIFSQKEPEDFDPIAPKKAANE